uniref:Uncharacterized mitochondrial protein AtMg00810-like n=1 Tax=Nicotiana tabacum TaxID=4097 RepID=A0A1S4AHB2_TOBAC|nr:PREDICTED: uncharacterized mitochondrial protein AtMg00810-like [Nicotiana tabacum]
MTVRTVISVAASRNWPLFTTVDYDTHVGGITDLVLPDATPYQKLIGKLLYLAITRPDINFVVHVLSQFMQQPKASHWEATLRLVRYLMGSSGQGILLKNNPCTQLTVFCDSDWAACLNTRKSVTGYIVKLGDSIISWKLKKQHTMSRSSAEAEYRSMTAAISKIASNPINHERTNHIEIDCHFVRGMIKEGLIVPEHVNTKNQLVDLLTKALRTVQHQFLLSKLGVLDVFYPPA